MLNIPKNRYQNRIDALVKTKLAQTSEKLRRFGYQNSDDWGAVPPPEDFHWAPKYNAENNFYGAKAWSENYRSLMEAMPSYVDANDALAGRWMLNLTGMRSELMHHGFDSSSLLPDQIRYGIVSGIGAPQHFAPDYTIGFELGWGGLLQKIRHHEAAHASENEATKNEFYQALTEVVLGIQSWISNTCEIITALIELENDEELRINLEEMLTTNCWIRENPPRSLREACQWIACFNMASRTFNTDGAGGHLDQLLLPFYQRDIAAGIIDDETAVYYLACLLLNDTHYYQLAGTLPDGNDATNHLSYLILEAAHRLGIACNLTVRVHDGMDQLFFHKAVQILCEDRQGFPRFCGDKSLVEGFTRHGYPPELARQRIAVGCHWMAIPGREYTVNDCVKINTAKVFTVALEEMESIQPEPSVADLWQRFEKHLRAAIAVTARGLDFQIRWQQFNAPELLLDLLCHGPIEKGIDASGGGVEYYDLCIDGSALATVADSFAALEQRIEIEGATTWPEIFQQLHANFAGGEGERIRLMMNSCQRYGRDGGNGDDWAKRVSQLFSNMVIENRTPEGRLMIPGWFSWSNTISMGKQVTATPNGRRAGEPISHGANPDPGFRYDGAPTAMARAIAAIQPGYGNTAPIQMEIDPGITRDEGGVDKIAALIKTHFQLGGTLFNLNVLDKAKLLAAHEDPSRYPDLVVRVTGFTAYFANLSPDFRQLVVNRLLE